MDFMSDQLFDGRPIRTPATMDAHPREGLPIAPGTNYRAA